MFLHRGVEMKLYRLMLSEVGESMDFPIAYAFTETEIVITSSSEYMDSVEIPNLLQYFVEKGLTKVKALELCKIVENPKLFYNVKQNET
jgi:hypothetical protein